MGFLRVVEVIPPLFPAPPAADARIDASAEIGRFLDGVRRVRRVADLILVANVKDPGVLKFDSTHAAIMLQEDLGVRAAPVVVTRDLNAPQFLSTMLTMVSLGVEGAMLAWGDDLSPSGGASNVRDFSGLAEAVRAAALVRSRAASGMKILAPVDLEELGNPAGVKMTKERLASGADTLLAQPPTTDPRGSFDRDASLVADAGLKEKVLLNVFPFRSQADVRRHEEMFGWRLPAALHRAAEGEGALLEDARGVVRRLRAEGFPGVYLATRGDPEVALRLLS